MNCRGCGVQIDPSAEQVNTAVDQILETSLKDAEKKGGVCPLCGHSKDVPYSQRKSVLFMLRRSPRYTEEDLPRLGRYTERTSTFFF
jgi:hypothetical protein